jgi:hypothetical protein
MSLIIVRMKMASSQTSTVWLTADSPEWKWALLPVRLPCERRVAPPRR